MKNGGHQSLTVIVNLKMSQRLLNNTKWLFCLLVFSVGPPWNPVTSDNVRQPSNAPSTIEAQAKFFQDFFSVQLSPYKIEFGHVCEDPNTWEQRYEKKDFKNHRDMGKVRWGDKQGGYGEHYWDLNHAGHAGNHDNEEYNSDDDDGSYHHDNEPYDEPSEQSPSYNDYDPEKAATYEETNRAKRAHSKLKPEAEDTADDVTTPRRKVRNESFNGKPDENQKSKRKLKRYKTKEINYDEDQADFDAAKVAQFEPKLQQPHQQKQNHHQQQLSHNQQHQHQQQQNQHQQQQSQDQQQQNKYQQQFEQQNHQQQFERQNQQQQFEQQNQQQQFKQQNQQQQFEQQNQQQQSHYVPYEDGSGVRHHQPEVTAAASAPRLFLEPSTGHVVDRATGQAYVLQPILVDY